MKTAALFLAAVLACASRVAARPLNRRLAQEDPLPPTEFKIDWDPAYAPYPRLNARCGDLVTFRWQGPTPQAVALIQSDFPADAAGQCSSVAPLVQPSFAGQYTATLQEPGTFYFVEPTSCLGGQVVPVTVSCDDAEQATAPAATAGAGAPSPAPAV